MCRGDAHIYRLLECLQDGQLHDVCHSQTRAGPGRRKDFRYQLCVCVSTGRRGVNCDAGMIHHNTGVPQVRTGAGAEVPRTLSQIS